MYQKALKKLRKPSKTAVLEEEQKPSRLISPRLKQQETNVNQDDPLAMFREMAETIRASGEATRGKRLALASSITSQSPEPKPAKKEEAEEVFDEEVGKERDEERKNRLPDLSSVSSRNGHTPVGNAKDWLDVIDRTEGGGSYSTLFGHSQNSVFSGTDVSKMTIGQIKQFADPKGRYANWVKGQVGRTATPMGRYQFVGTTLSTVAKEMGLSDDTVFSPAVQDRMFEHYLGKRLAQGSSMSEKINQVRQAWEGFKNVPKAQLAQLIRKTENKGIV